MAKTPPAIGAGNVTITLGGKEVVLRPSLDACLALSKAPGIDFWNQQVRARVMDAYKTVITAGLGMKGPSKDMPELIYQAGLFDLMAPLLEFLNNVSNGGRPLVEKVQCTKCGSWYDGGDDLEGREEENPQTESS